MSLICGGGRGVLRIISADRDDFATICLYRKGARLISYSYAYIIGILGKIQVRKKACNTLIDAMMEVFGSKLRREDGELRCP